jgi:hypothetical protein
MVMRCSRIWRAGREPRLDSVWRVVPVLDCALMTTKQERQAASQAGEERRRIRLENEAEERRAQYEALLQETHNVEDETVQRILRYLMERVIP